MDKINELKSIPMHEQRSDAWFKQRENKLTSSDAGTVLGLNPYQKPKEVLFKKCGHDPKPFVGNIATRHGQKYEDEAIEKYCKLFYIFSAKKSESPEIGQLFIFRRPKKSMESGLTDIGPEAGRQFPGLEAKPTWHVDRKPIGFYSREGVCR